MCAGEFVCGSVCFEASRLSGFRGASVCFKRGGLFLRTGLSIRLLFRMRHCHSFVARGRAARVCDIRVVQIVFGDSCNGKV